MKVRRTFLTSVPVGAGPAAWRTDESALMQRVELILSTPQGSLPWRPEFGCAIWRLVGQPATAQHLAEARWSIEEAIARWVPEIEVERCDLTLVLDRTGGDAALVRTSGLSPIESGLLHLGVEGILQIDLTLKARKGMIRARLELLS